MQKRHQRVRESGRLPRDAGSWTLYGLTFASLAGCKYQSSVEGFQAVLTLNRFWWIMCYVHEEHYNCYCRRG